MTELMNPDEAKIATDLYAAIQEASNYSDRAQQAARFRVGLSDLGFCSERTRRMLDQQVAEPTDALAAAIGTAIGSWVEAEAVPKVWPNAIIQSTVLVAMQGEGHEYMLEGHPDVVLPEGVVIDLKTAFGLTYAERSGPSQQQQFQRHCYALGAYNAGLFNDNVDLADVQVANVWIDRSAGEKRLHVNMEPYNPEVIKAAAEWLDEVVYAYLQHEEARKEPPRELCAAACGFFGPCRGHDTDVEGLIRDPAALTAVDMYAEGLDLEKRGRKLKNEAKHHLAGVEGSTGKHTVRWTHVNATEVSFTRNAYDKLEVRPLGKGGQ